MLDSPSQVAHSWGMSLTLHLLVAPSASGKSTYAKILLERPRTCLVSPDLMREELTGDMSDQSKNGFIFGTLLFIRLNGASARNENVVLDATNTTRKARKTIIEHAKGLGYRIEAHVFRVPIEVCKARNAARARQVPLDVIERQFAQWQEPNLDEGLDAIVEVPFVP